jgi:hypothetical protein
METTIVFINLIHKGWLSIFDGGYPSWEYPLVNQQNYETTFQRYINEVNGQSIPYLYHYDS